MKSRKSSIVIGSIPSKPLFQHSNWGEATKFRNLLYVLAKNSIVLNALDTH